MISALLLAAVVQCSSPEHYQLRVPVGDEICSEVNETLPCVCGRYLVFDDVGADSYDIQRCNGPRCLVVGNALPVAGQVFWYFDHDQVDGELKPKSANVLYEYRARAVVGGEVGEWSTDYVVFREDSNLLRFVEVPDE